MIPVLERIQYAEWLQRELRAVCCTCEIIDNGFRCNKRIFGHTVSEICIMSDLSDPQTVHIIVAFNTVSFYGNMPIEWLMDYPREIRIVLGKMIAHVFNGLVDKILENFF